MKSGTWKIPVQTSAYVMLSSDYSQQEPKILAHVSADPNMQKAFKAGRDIYATIASIAFNVPYESCLEFHPDTHEYQPQGKARRSEAKSVVLGICYGRSVVTVGEQLYGADESLSTEDKTKKAQKVYDGVLAAFPNLQKIMDYAQSSAKSLGYVETILGRRRHIPNMMLDQFEFEAMPGYVNPNLDPLDVTTFQKSDGLPENVKAQLKSEFSKFKYFGQIVNRTHELYNQHIRVINNRSKITDASRECLNSIIQGSAADMTKMAILNIENSEEWHKLGGRILVPVHDELICEVPIDSWEEGGELLSKLMSEAGNFLPFPINCDVETSLRWYGLEYPCPYTEPDDLEHELTEDEIKWLQYHIIETEVALPVYKKEGESLRGNAAKGINGIMSEELQNAIQAYIARYDINKCDFINHIKTYVKDGISV